VRVPFAENSTHAVPDGVTDEQMITLADILPTAYEVGVLNGTVRPADCHHHWRRPIRLARS
jgi:alcohol dehydrogenase